jgi:hypothetical protein
VRAAGEHEGSSLLTLPFTIDQFLDVFAAYNSAFWPVAALLWLASCAVVVQLIRRGPRASIAVSVLLSVHWAWAGLAYHLAFFREVNPAATVFGMLFIVQSGLFAWRGFFGRKLEYHVTRSMWSRLGIGLIAYALLYPLVGLALGLGYPRMPTFGVPCPTTILTVGLLLLVPGRELRWIAVIPLVWSAIGGSAVFFLRIHADSMLLVAGIVLLVRILRPSTASVQPA